MLLQLLLEMLSLAADMRIQLAAVECLLAVTGRRVIFLILYSQFVLVLSDRFSVLYKSVMFFSVLNCANAKFKKIVVRKKERKSIYIAPFCTEVHTKCSGMDHTVLPTNTMPAFPSWHSPDVTTTATEAADIQLQLTTHLLTPKG